MVVIESTFHGFDAIEAKTSRLEEIVGEIRALSDEAKSLAEELASCEIAVSSKVVE